MTTRSIAIEIEGRRMNEWEYLINSFNQKVGSLNLRNHEKVFGFWAESYVKWVLGGMKD